MWTGVKVVARSAVLTVAAVVGLGACSTARPSSSASPTRCHPVVPSSVPPGQPVHTIALGELPIVVTAGVTPNHACPGDVLMLQLRVVNTGRIEIRDSLRLMIGCGDMFEVGATPFEVPARDSMQLTAKLTVPAVDSESDGTCAAGVRGYGDPAAFHLDSARVPTPWPTMPLPAP